MDIIRRARKLEATLSRSMDRFATRLSPDGEPEPLETLDAIVTAIARRVEPVGRGRHVFPFDEVTVHLAAATAEDRARLDAVFGATPSLQDRVAAALRAAGCESVDVAIDVVFTDTRDTAWSHPAFHVLFARRPVTSMPPETEPTSTLHVTVKSGTAAEPHYVFSGATINIGRCAEVRDRGDRLLRVNHVAFADAANPTVSRQHAHLDYIASRDEYRICDDRSSHGTSVIRKGRTVPVPPGPRGIRLLDGDEIVLGDARLLVERAEPR